MNEAETKIVKQLEEIDGDEQREAELGFHNLMVLYTAYGVKEIEARKADQVAWDEERALNKGWYEGSYEETELRIKLYVKQQNKAEDAKDKAYDQFIVQLVNFKKRRKKKADISEIRKAIESPEDTK